MQIFLLLCILFPMSTQAQTADDYVGRWALYLPNGAGWLNVHTDNGYLDAEMLWIGGSVVPVASAHMSNGKLIVTRTRKVKRDENRSHQVTHTFVFEKGFDELVGKAYLPHNDGNGENVVTFRGKKLPPLPATPNLSAAQYGDPIELFNGKNLNGWKLINKKQKNGWKVQDGLLVNDPKQPAGDPYHYSYGNLRTTDTFKDFNLKLDVKIPEGSNSGVYLRGIYEIQVADTYGQGSDPHYMGALYSRITPSVPAEKPAGEWQQMDITLYKHHITVILNGKKIINNQPIQGVTGGAMTADEFSPGPLYLQGDHGQVFYRNIVLTPITR